MSTSLREFQIELYEEYLEEASFLYEQRLSLLTDPEISWPELDDFEERLEAYLDALVVGGTLALEICQRQAIEGDFGELHAAICVFCRQDQEEMVHAVIDSLDQDDEEKVCSVAEALAVELPSSWEARFASHMTNPETPAALVRILARCLGARRAAVMPQLKQALAHGPLDARHDVLWALSRTGDRSLRPLFAPLLKDSDSAVRGTAMHAFLRMRDLEASKRLDEMVADPSLHHLVGLGGNRSLVKKLIWQAKNGQAGPQTMIAIGMLGDPEAVPILLSSLQDEQLAVSAAQGLDLITGAGTVDEVFEPEQIETDELFDHELEKLEQGKPPVRADGEPFGETKVEISTDHEYWSTWWRVNGDAFNPAIRYRNGKRYSPSSLLESIEAPSSPSLIRQLAYDELVVRYGLDVPFDPEARVTRQKDSIEEIRRWVAQRSAGIQEGSWYFGGRFLA